MSDAGIGDTMVHSSQGAYDALRHVSPETPCPYLPGRLSRSEAYFLETLDGPRHEHLLAQGFRRSGHVMYRPRCRGCSACCSLRVPVSGFRATRSMRRVWRRNGDLRVTERKPVATMAKFSLFCRYLDYQHDQTMDRSYDSFREFLYESPTATREFSYRLGRRVIGISLADRWKSGLSSVYMFFDPDFASRSLGTYSALWEIDLARREGLSYYYLGYYVAGSKTMAYKARFRPFEILLGEDHWVTVRE